MKKLFHYVTEIAKFMFPFLILACTHLMNALVAFYGWRIFISVTHFGLPSIGYTEWIAIVLMTGILFHPDAIENRIVPEKTVAAFVRRMVMLAMLSAIYYIVK